MQFVAVKRTEPHRTDRKNRTVKNPVKYRVYQVLLIEVLGCEPHDAKQKKGEKNGTPKKKEDSTLGIEPPCRDPHYTSLPTHSCSYMITGQTDM